MEASRIAYINITDSEGNALQLTVEETGPRWRITAQSRGKQEPTLASDIANLLLREASEVEREAIC